MKARVISLTEVDIGVVSSPRLIVLATLQVTVLGINLPHFSVPYSELPAGAYVGKEYDLGIYEVADFPDTIN
jgi:hypothetical protein